MSGKISLSLIAEKVLIGWSGNVSILFGNHAGFMVMQAEDTALTRNSLHDPEFNIWYRREPESDPGQKAFLHPKAFH